MVTMSCSGVLSFCKGLESFLTTFKNHMTEKAKTSKNSKNYMWHSGKTHQMSLWLNSGKQLEKVAIIPFSCL